MPVPKRRTTKSKRNMRRRSHKMVAGASNICPNCKAYKRPHAVCPACGTYKGKPVQL